MKRENTISQKRRARTSFSSDTPFFVIVGYALKLRMLNWLITAGYSSHGWLSGWRWQGETAQGLAFPAISRAGFGLIGRLHQAWLRFAAASTVSRQSGTPHR
jgi:hypothetical protein